MSSVFILSILILIAKIIAGAFLLILFFAVGVRLLVEPSIRMCKCQTKLYGKVALVSGGNTGIGFETAKDLARRGARVVIASRNDKKSEEAVAVIKELSGNNNVEYRHLDLEKLDSVKEFAYKFNKDFDRLHILVNNAGCGKMKSGITEHGIDLLMQINYIGPVLLTNLLLDKLIISKPSRIVNISSVLHIFDFNPEEIVIPRPRNIFVRYSYTKLCVILWTKELSKRLPHGVTANVLHPGIVNTDIYNHLVLFLRYLMSFVLYILFKSAEQGAQTSIHLCVSPTLENSTGGYYENCKEAKTAKRAEDSDLAKRVWDQTMAVIKQ